MNQDSPRALKLGASVRITRGLAVGVVGVVVEKWSSHFGRESVSLWRIASEDLVRSRVMRADHLEVLP